MIIIFSEKDVYAGGSTAGETASWAGWAVTGVTSLTAKFYKSGGVTGTSMQGISTSPNVTEMRKSPPSTKSAANGDKIYLLSIHSFNLCILFNC